MPEHVSSPIHGLFNNKSLRKTFLALRVPLGVLFLIVLLTQVEPGWFVPGLLVSVAGQLLQVWCMATIKTQKKLTVTGPYMFVRNPMYLGRFLLVSGVVMMTGSFLFLGVVSLVYYFYMVNRVRREEQLLAGLFGEEYKAYCRDVRPYFPGMKRFNPAGLWSFNRESVVQNNVLTNIALPCVCYVLLYVSTLLRAA
ncbi:methyltransferase family protein [Desulfoluna spongiiphila]|uniref:Protein-S-isoprenylcysteine O-methyltransferase Ste14 n=1 Tax=Desulfoluna spongiiphila TaxID=419481 RepID=A0A1G5IR69_9BACT|nr:isoprenylcysteine carboxylmethyltransferase family protein [Desulfoluna spongiiphila]SCY78477.1 Protein-S-isoprenylcysteine O-methyltransferase Ste14 [Desulfoluna spongiiphila]